MLRTYSVIDGAKSLRRINNCEIVFIDTRLQHNETLNNMPISKRRTWSLKVMHDLRPQLNKGDHIVILAGRKYREFLVEPLRSAGCQVDIPMEGLRIGEQLSWLSQQAG